MHSAKWILVAFSLSACASMIVPPYQGPVSDHFDGQRFHNLAPGIDDSIANGIKQELQRPEGRAFWPPWEESPRDVPPRRVGGGRIRVSFVNHATVLIQTDSLNILTDPVWSRYASPTTFIAPRHRAPGIRFEDLPPIDLVLLSHNHYDHMDVPTLRRLAKKFHPKIITGLGNTKFLERNGIRGAQDIDWWQSVQIAPGFRIAGVPSQHYSARWVNDRWRTLWLGFVLESPSGRLYFAGDTGLGDFFKTIRERFAPFRFVMLPISPGLPVRAMGPQHMSAEDAVKAYRMLGATAAMGIHFGTFQQGDERQHEPAEALKTAIGAQSCPIRFWALRNGEALDVPAETTRSRSVCG
jgi:L-ascorbate metabolism protein UlaG (beta-lactamase superfamily)